MVTRILALGVLILLTSCGEIGIHKEELLYARSKVSKSCLIEAAGNIDGLKNVHSFGSGIKGRITHVFDNGSEKVYVQELVEPEHVLKVSFSYMEHCPCPGKDKRHLTGSRKQAVN